MSAPVLPETVSCNGLGPGDTTLMQPKQRKFTDEIRQAILDAKGRGLSRYVIAKTVGASESVLSGFVNGKHGISSDLLDRIAPLLGLRLVVGRAFTSRRKPR